MSSFLFTFLETLLSKTAITTTALTLPTTIRVVVHGPKELPWYVGATAPNVDHEIPNPYASKAPATCLDPAS